jgi:hypothetical protein
MLNLDLAECGSIRTTTATTVMAPIVVSCVKPAYTKRSSARKVAGIAKDTARLAAKKHWADGFARQLPSIGKLHAAASRLAFEPRAIQRPRGSYLILLDTTHAEMFVRVTEGYASSNASGPERIRATPLKVTPMNTVTAARNHQRVLALQIRAQAPRGLSFEQALQMAGDGNVICGGQREHQQTMGRNPISPTTTAS